MSSVAETEIPTVETVKAVENERLSAYPASGSPSDVDEAGGIIKGFVVAEEGPFRTGRGAFDAQSLRTIVDLMAAQPDGVLVNYGHQEKTGTSEALDAFTGRAKNPRVDGTKVRADLYFNPVASLSENGGESRAKKLMIRAKTDPASFGNSLVLSSDKVFRLDSRGRRMADDAGNPLPPIWRPVGIVSTDIVYMADAVRGGFLNADDEAFTKASAALDEAFAGFDRETVCKYFDLYATSRFGDQWGVNAFPWCSELAKQTADAEPVMCSAEEAEVLRLRWENKKRKAI